MRKDKEFDDTMDARLEEELLVPPYRTKHPEFPPDAAQKNGAGESRFLRGNNRLPARRRMSQRGQWVRWLRVSAVVLGLAGVVVVGWAARNFLRHDARFQLASSAEIELQGNQIVARPEVVHVFAGDVGRSVFTVPLAARKTEIEKIPWVHSAAVMRLWPNRLRVAIVERTPVAYLRDGNSIDMVDADGVILEMPPKGLQHSSFPVVTGIAEKAGHATDTQRAEKMHLYLQFMAALDAGGSQNSQAVSEVNLTDAEDIRAVIADGTSAGANEILVHFGDSDFLARYEAFVAHRAEWLRQYPRLASVDMRYGRQVVLKMASGDVANAAVKNSSTTGAPSADGNLSGSKPAAGEGGR